MVDTTNVEGAVGRLARIGSTCFTTTLLIVPPLLSLPSRPAPTPYHPQAIVPVPLDPFVNNTGIAGTNADFDGAGNTFPSTLFPADNSLALDGVQFRLTRHEKDNVVALGQTIPLPRARFACAFFLVASTSGESVGTVTFHYADGSTTRAPLDAPDWVKLRESPALETPTRIAPPGPEAIPAGLFLEQAWMDLSRPAVSVTLPVTHLPAPNKPSTHIFALSLFPVTHHDNVSLFGLHMTSKLTERRTRVVEGLLQNTGNIAHTPSNPLTVAIKAPGITTVAPARITRLPLGEETPVEIGVRVRTEAPPGSAVSATAIAQSRKVAVGQVTFNLVIPSPTFTSSESSLSSHTTPDWYDGAKFGIFIHYGLYSIPAWAPVGGVYAEWYWHSMEQKDSPTYQHQLATYGPDFQYDDFISQFKAKKFNPKAWVHLFRAAGARYFVMVAKHHDGYALFRTRYGHRNSVDTGPHRDLVAQLFAAARKYAPEIHAGVYYSLPEWFNPSYPGIAGKHGKFPGGTPHDYVTGAAIPYTGFAPVASYVADYQVPQMDELIDRYHPDILWCDVGGQNDSLQVLAHFYNSALVRGRQVVANNRCGVSAHDFTTAEYNVYSDTVHAKWEASRGLDPHSYGYNANTPDAGYASAASLVRELVDVVSKNGNLLLDIGPKGDASIPGVMQRRLGAIGSWLKVNGQAIYNTTYWWRTSSDGNLRFTERPNHAFYVISLTRPGPRVTVHEPLPLLPGDHITLLGWSGGPLHWSRHQDGLVIDVPGSAQKSGKYAWVFKISAA